MADETKSTASDPQNATGGTDLNASLNDHLLNIAKADILNTMRMKDTIKEKLSAALLTKVDKMEPSDIMDMISKLDTLSNYESNKKLIDLFQ